MTCSRPVRVSRSASARASSIVAGSRSTPSSVSMMTSVGSRPLVSTWWTESSRSSGSMPSENVRQACGSRSTSSTRWPSSARAAPSEATVVVLATPPFWLATRVWWSSRPIMPDRVARSRRHLCWTHVAPRSAASWTARRTARHRPGHRPHRRHRPRVRPPARRAAATTSCSWPATSARLEAVAAELRAAYGVAGRGAARRPRRPRRSWPGSRPGSPTATGRSTCWSTTPASGSRSASSTTPSTQEQAMLDVLVTAVLRLSHAALGADGRARPRRHHQRLQRRGVPAPRHLQRREGVGEQLQRVGAPRVRARAACT